MNYLTSHRFPQITIIAFLCLSGLFAQSPRFPFPQHVQYTKGAIKPSTQTQAQLDAAVKSFYDVWKSKYLKPGCTSGQYYVEYVNGSEICVSEGQGYGMVITAYMAGYDTMAKTYYDGLYRWYKANPSTVNPILMNWQQNSKCVSDGTDAATDGDLDIAYSLLLADKQWGSSGSINYLSEALAIINAIKQSEVYPVVSSLQLGDWAHDDSQYKNDTRPSDFMYDHFRAFNAATNDATWNSVLNECYNLIDTIQTRYSPNTGLIPDFIENCDSVPHPAKSKFLESSDDGYYNYNSCRTPWHFGTDYLLNGDVRAKNDCNKITQWLKKLTSNKVSSIRSGYKLDGSNISGNNYQDMAFMAPFAVGACVDTAHQVWLNDLWNYVTTDAVSNSDYFGNTLKMLCMIVIAGDYWAPQQITDAVGESGNIAVPSSYQLRNFPNPFNPSTTIQFSVPRFEKIQGKIYNLYGKEICTLVDGFTPAGMHVLEWNPAKQNLASGVYFFRLATGEFQQSIKLVYLK
jgi:endo-1,4-beta-D-glucanase Y